MSGSKRGRPAKNYNKVDVANLVVEFLAKKRNGYDADICYMKVVDKDIKKKLKHVTSLEADGIRMPYWRTDDTQEMILKVKDKFMGSIEPCEQGMVYSIDAEFQSYCIEKENDEDIKGYFLKVPSMKKCDFEVDVQSN